MKHQLICPCPTGTVVLQTESVPFSDFPGQSRLFLDYQNDPASLRRFYPNAVVSHTDVASRIPEVLANQQADRGSLCDVLEEANRSVGAGEKTLANIGLLRDPDCVAVVSGQQAGLLSGPLYTVYKALSAIQMTECLRGRGYKAVPVFWIATEDHDFLEVSNTFVIDRGGDLAEIKSEPKRCYENLPVGYVKLDETIGRTIEDLFTALPRTEFTADLRSAIETDWRAGVEYGEAFARTVSRLMSKYGLILLCPLDARLKRLAMPVYRDAILKSEEIVAALRRRSDELVAEGYHAQVLIEEDYFPLFWQAPDRTRNALKKGADGVYRTKDGKAEFTLGELAEMAESSPESFSPSVVLRSVVQDYLLPTVCYFGGAAEIAYFAQSAEVYRLLGRPVTPIFHRQSFTVVESRHGKALEKYGLTLADLFKGQEQLLPRIVEEHLNRDAGRLFADVEERVNTELNRLDQALSGLEPTLAENLANRRKKIVYHLANLRTKFHHAQIAKDEVVRRQIDNLFSALLPHRHLQERTLNASSFINRHGFYFIDWLFEAIDLDDKGHRIVYL